MFVEMDTKENINMGFVEKFYPSNSYNEVGEEPLYQIVFIYDLELYTITFPHINERDTYLSFLKLEYGIKGDEFNTGIDFSDN
jgi:hypothetical protein